MNIAPAAWAPIEHEGRGYLFLHPTQEDHIFKQQMKRRTFYERDLLEKIRELAPPGPIVDVGAHVGNHSVYFAGVMGRQVYAFESNPAVLPYLATNVAPYDVQVFGCALMDEDRSYEVVPGPEGNTGMARIETAAECGADTQMPLGWRRTIDLDALCLPPIAVFKLDVEGCETLVLEGASATIAESVEQLGRILVVAEAQTPEARGYVYAQLRCVLGMGGVDDPSYAEAYRDTFNLGPAPKIVEHGPFCATPTYIWEITR